MSMDLERETDKKVNSNLLARTLEMKREFQRLQNLFSEKGY